jgi:hypothetical protein
MIAWECGIGQRVVTDGTFVGTLNFELGRLLVEHIVDSALEGISAVGVGHELLAEGRLHGENPVPVLRIFEGHLTVGGVLVLWLHKGSVVMGNQLDSIAIWQRVKIAHQKSQSIRIVTRKVRELGQRSACLVILDLVMPGNPMKVCVPNYHLVFTSEKQLTSTQKYLEHQGSVARRVGKPADLRTDAGVVVHNLLLDELELTLLIGYQNSLETAFGPEVVLVS